MRLDKIHIFLTMLTTMLMSMLLSACSSSDGPGITDVTKLGEPVNMYISVPTDSANSDQTRVGDPGYDAQTKQDWDKLAIIVAYKKKNVNINDYDAEPQRMVYWDIFHRSEFESQEKIEHSMSILEAPEANNGTRAITMYLPVGTVNVYGVTYSDGCGFNLEETLNQIAKDGSSHNSEIEALAISNDYAKGKPDELAKFLSVATGYGVDTRTSARDLIISKGNDEIEMKQYWAMYLTRLATKLDIQWDAQGAYESDYNDKDKIIYTDVKVSSFQYDGGKTDTDANAPKGYGRLFPSLQTASGTSSVAPLGGKVDFYNHTEISRRNGRVYHYLFPDGSKSPRITFHIDATYPSNNGTEGTSGTDVKRQVDYTLDFTQQSSDKFPFKQASWYKINVTIKGVSQSSETVTIDKF